MLVSSFFSSKIITKPKKIFSSCRASKCQFPLTLTDIPLVNTSGRVQFSSPAQVMSVLSKVSVCFLAVCTVSMYRGFLTNRLHTEGPVK